MDDWKDKLNMVYSTNPNYKPDEEEVAEQPAIQPSKQNLIVGIERKNRGGKTVTWIRGFVGSDLQMDELCKKIKKQCGVGGSAKSGEIIIQGDNKQKIADMLKSWSFKVKVSG